MKIDIIAADQFTIQELTELYNQTRVDYLVPMPMNSDRLSEYIHDFDVNLRLSCVAQTTDKEVLGLSMLGTRNNIGWVTRLGVLPAARRTGAGSALMEHMIQNAHDSGIPEIHLEVIKNNEPAYHLFRKNGFEETGTYLVMRRAPLPITETPTGKVYWLNFEDALKKLSTYPRHLTWINAYNSMRNSPNTEGVCIEMPDGSSGWLVYRNTKFTLRSTLSHLIMHTEQGDPLKVGTQLLTHLHTSHSHHDTYAENIHENDPHRTAFETLGYFSNFSRIEMQKK